MNSVKNAIVTMTLLAVGYGAYVVLSNPVPDDLGELAEGTVWEAPEVTSPEADSNPAASIADADSNTGTATETPVAPSHIPPAEETLLPPSDLASPWPAASESPSKESQPPTSTASSPTRTPTGPAGSPADAQENFYVSQAESRPSSEGASPPATAGSAGIDSAAVGAAPLSTPAGTAPVSDATGNPAPSAGTAGDPAGNPEFETIWQTAQTDLRSGQIGEVLGTLSAWYEEPSLTQQQHERLVTLLDQLAGTVIYSRDSFLEPGHVVQQDETLLTLAEQYQVPAEFLARINGIEAPFELFPGETIKVVQGPFRAEVNCARGQITLFLGRYYGGRFPTRIGPELPGGPNTFEVASIEPGIEFFDTRSGIRIARDDPNNPYGSVWISLRGNQITTAHRVGIHVDNGEAEWGSIGVNQADANDLAAILGPNSVVQIKP